jgi:catechol 2,3-dioxygenase-like lactoylglutathione lyase family enzyme
MDMKLELVILPADDLDVAKEFYADRAGFHVDVDHQAENFRVVQLTPPGSACSVTLMKATSPARVQGLHLMVSDVEAARAELVGRGVDVSEPFHFENGSQTPGPDPQRGDYNTFASFSDPDGNGWVLQERKPG